jgi:RNA polymerase sigma-70 factor (ECF subfamily)
MTPGESVPDLIRRCRSGDAAAREKLFQSYQHYLHLLAVTQLGRHLRAKCDPSDLVQQTLLEAHRDFAGFHGEQEAELLAWLRRILAHNLYNEARRYAAQQRDAARELSLDQLRTGVEQSSIALARCLADGDPSPSSVASRRERGVLLANALARLPEDYRTVLLLRVFEELSAEEVARRMNRTAGAIRMIQMRALAALRAQLDADGAADELQ